MAQKPTDPPIQRSSESFQLHPEMTALSPNQTRVAIALFAINAAGLAYKAATSFNDPQWFNVRIPRWYHHALTSIAFLVVTLACVHYLRRIQRNALSKPTKAGPTPWATRVEWRVIIYTLACHLMLQVPLDTVTAIRVYNDTTLPWQKSLWDVFPTDAIVSVIIGIAIILYDRRRTRREAREQHGLCQRCGYDLRATPTRCPECGEAKLGGPVTTDNEHEADESASRSSG